MRKRLIFPHLPDETEIALRRVFTEPMAYGFPVKGHWITFAFGCVLTVIGVAAAISIPVY